MTLAAGVFKYACRLCGRNKFPFKMPHKCVGGYRKRHILWRIKLTKPAGGTLSHEGYLRLMQFNRAMGLRAWRKVSLWNLGRLFW